MISYRPLISWWTAPEAVQYSKLTAVFLVRLPEIYFHNASLCPVSLISVSVECKAQAGEESCSLWRIFRTVFNRRSSRITGKYTNTGGMNCASFKMFLTKTQTLISKGWRVDCAKCVLANKILVISLELIM